MKQKLFATVWNVGVSVEMENKILNCRGFIMLNVIFLTLIVSLVAIIFLNGSEILNRSNATLRITAMNLIDEQFAEVESRAAHGNLSVGTLGFLGVEEDLKSYNLDEKNPIDFKVSTVVQNTAYENLFNVVVKVTWTLGEKNFEIESEKFVHLQN